MGLEYNDQKFWTIDPTGGRKDNPGYSAPFPIWWKTFGLNGSGYAIGENKEQRKFIEAKLKQEYSVDKILSVNIDKSGDVKSDITKERLAPMDFIFCMAVLEHVVDFSPALKNMGDSLYLDGYLFLSVPVNGFKQHRRPIDCYRFLADAIKAFGDISRTTLLDFTQCGWEWCAVYVKRCIR